MPKTSDSPESVQLLDMPKYDPTLVDAQLEERWNTFIACREVVMGELEQARKSKVIGHPLDAAVTIIPDTQSAAALKALETDLARLFIVSQVVLLAPADTLQVTVEPAKGEKCARCWVHSESVGSNAQHPCLCARCAQVLDV